MNGFYNELRDFVGSAEVGFVDGKFTVQNTNVAKTRSQGVEVMATVRLGGGFTATANYTFTDAEVVEGDLEGNLVEGVPEHMVSASLHYQQASGFAFDLRGRYVDESYQDITNEALMESDFIVDVFAAYRFSTRFEIVLTAENLLDEEYIADGFGGNLGAPRQVSGGLRVSF